MSIVRSAESLELVRKAYEGNGADLQIANLIVRKAQKEMLVELARRNGESQAAVLRAILDEWCAMKLAGT